MPKTKYNSIVIEKIIIKENTAFFWILYYKTTKKSFKENNDKQYPLIIWNI